MTWGLTKEHTYETNLDSEDMMTRLRSIVDRKNKFKKGVMGITNKISKPYYGFVRETTFDFYNTPTLWNDSSIQITGKINRAHSDMKKKVTIIITPANNLIPSLVGIAFCILPLTSLLIRAELKTILQSLLFPLAGFAFIYLPFQINYIETRNKLENLLRLKDTD